MQEVGGGGEGPGAGLTKGGDAGGLISYRGLPTNLAVKVSSQTDGHAFGYARGGYGSQSWSGGGGGYYGGDTTTTAPMTTVGGSSFISGHLGCDAITGEDDRTPTGQPIHYSGKKFTNTIMIDGAGYSWTDVIGDYT